MQLQMNHFSSTLRDYAVFSSFRLVVQAVKCIKKKKNSCTNNKALEKYQQSKYSLSEIFQTNTCTKKAH